MPELPEVETIVRDLCRQKLIGQKIRKVHVYWKRTVAEPPLKEFLSRIENTIIQRIYRRAKLIVISLSSGDTLLIHLRMTGRIHLCPAHTPRTTHDHVVVNLEGHRDLRFRDSRKFGRWYLIKNPHDYFARLGPEPLNPPLRFSCFQKRLKRYHRKLKPLLLDQSFVAGLGNIYADESLWQARLHPERLSASLSTAEIKNLYDAIRSVLKRGIRNLGTSLGQSDYNYYSVGGRRGRNQDELNVFRRTGAPCPRCNNIIERILVGQRSTHICPSCQK
ncbi:MAG: bifunctional DNA-formamidopyrimidine glycosylase/DNA-(apurinic or apyrimidinic site) lyase [Candidatus Omnitrophica bacterium]|nr:bifunctional DNA-formamidopyrimidine glycosylase/DNA-(apurinic or apyrimidinic site) lyase [Candidatus Omnitrophota bacterium]